MEAEKEATAWWLKGWDDCQPRKDPKIKTIDPFLSPFLSQTLKKSQQPSAAVTQLVPCLLASILDRGWKANGRAELTLKQSNSLL